MSKVIAIGGEPATGKTTLVRKFLGSLTEDFSKVEKFGVLRYHQVGKIVVLGDYSGDGLFSGTDRLSMSVQPDASKFVMEAKDLVIVFEGDRLFNSKFLELCQDVSNLSVMILRAPAATINFRHHDRKDTQNEQFIRSRQTKVDNICTNFSLMDAITEYQNVDYEAQEKILGELKRSAGLLQS